MNKQIIALFSFSLLLFSCANKNHADQVEYLDVADSTEVAEAFYEEIETYTETYHATESVYTDLIHTKLEVNFDWEKSRMNGKASITAKPHFYPSDSLILDAKGMDIKSVQMNGKDLNYDYKNDFLKIKLGKSFTRNEKYTVDIVYVAKPDERTLAGSAAITSDKGLYFINPKGEQNDKMPQIWTQGETEASSVWFPTIDAPNVKTSQEILMTVDNKYTTLSNGKMISSKKNADGTRTDHWKQDLPHAPYLFMMAVGEFKVVNDFYTKKDGSKMPVNYYVEKEWEPYAKDIFGETPNMIAYFSQLLKVEYPWDKYDQIVVREYVSGAMENTGAVVFGDYAYKTKRELLDDNDQSTIAHELFHHWFGDLVTAESWSNLTLNESFANYSQYLWDEFKFGINEADYQASQEENGYFQSAEMNGYHDLVWFSYEDKEQMFDGHSYNKGGRILHMLRNYLGDEAFFEGLSNYLNTNKFKAAEFQQLRLAFEEVCGEDLNWFFNQWYLASGHPTLTISQNIDDETKKVTLYVSQMNADHDFPIFKLPVDIAIYDSKGKTTHKIILEEGEQEISLPFEGTLKSVIFDESKMLLAKIEESKPTDQLVFQYYNSPRYKARLQALHEGFEEGNSNSEQMVLDALNDEFWNLRMVAIEQASLLPDSKKDIALKIIKNLAINDSKSQVRAAAVSYLAQNMEGEEQTNILSEIISKDQSYLVIGNALKDLSQIDPSMAMEKAIPLESEKSSKMLSSIAQIYGTYGEENKTDFFTNTLKSGKLSGIDELMALNSFTLFNGRMSESQIEKALPTYQYLEQKGGYYTKMFLGQNADYMLQVFEERKLAVADEMENHEKNKDAESLLKSKEKLKKIEGLMDQFSKLIPEE